MQRPVRDTEGPLRISVSGCKQISGVGLVTMGRVEVGTVKKDDMVQLARGGISGKVFSIEMHHKSVDAAIAGFNVGMVGQVSKGNKIQTSQTW